MSTKLFASRLCELYVWPFYFGSLGLQKQVKINGGVYGEIVRFSVVLECSLIQIPNRSTSPEPMEIVRTEYLKLRDQKREEKIHNNNNETR